MPQGATATASLSDFEPEGGATASLSDFEPEKAEAAPAKSPAETDFENNVMAQAAATIPKPHNPIQDALKEREAILNGSNPGAFEGNYENLGGWVEEGPLALAKAAGRTARDVGPNPAVGIGMQPKQVLHDVSDVASAAGMTALPALPIQAAAAPATMAAGYGAGYLASKGAGALAKKLGADELTKQDIENLAFWTPALIAHVTGLRGEATATDQSKSAVVSAFGDRAGVGVSKGPQGVTVGAKVGPFSGTHTFGGEGTPELEPPTIEGTPGAGQAITPSPQGPATPPIPQATDDPIAQATSAINAKTADEARASRQAQGIPEAPPPAPPPGPPPILEITPERMMGLAKTLQKLPPDIRPRALIEMHGVLSDQLLRQGKVIGPDGKLEVVDSPKTAARIAQQFINDEVERQDKLAEKQASKPAENKSASPAPEENPIAQAKALPKVAPANTAPIEAFTKEEEPNESPSQRTSVEGNQPTAAESHQASGSANGEGRNLSTAIEPGNAARRTGREAFTKGDRVQLEDGRRGTITYTSPQDPFVRVRLEGGGQVSKGISKLTKVEVESGNGKTTAAETGGRGNENSGGAANNAGPAAGVPSEREGRNGGPATGAGNNAGGSESNVPPSAVPPAAAGVSPSGGTAPNAERGTGSALGSAEGRNTEVPKYKFGNTQANIPEDSEAHRALESARARISPDDLAGKGADIGGNHVTVRGGIKGDDTERIKQYLSQQEPFEATLGKTEKFEPTEHSEGAAVIKAPIESPDLARMNEELEKHGDFTEPSFKEYKPHATIAYVKPEKADLYVGMSVTHGKKFKVSEVAISKRDGSQEVVKLEGKKKPVATPQIAPLAEKTEVGPEKGQEGQSPAPAVAPPRFTVRKAHIEVTPENGVRAVPQEEKDLISHLSGKISSGEMPKDNPALKRIVEEFDRAVAEPARMKQAQEALEVAIVKRARAIVAEEPDDSAAFDKLVALYDSQPNLNIRTSTSIENQAYSTPAPLAFLAGRLAGVTRRSTGYEPTAGNGMLVITGDPRKWIVNEWNAERVAGLKAQGFRPIQGDALKADVDRNSVDAVLANPPFGSVKDDKGEATKVRVDGYKIGQIDHLIAATALDAMKAQGRATLILGANKFSAGEQSNDDTIFLNWLYSHYNVAGHFELDGKLYGRQGAAWPVRVIVIGGRQASGNIAPRVGTIKRVETWKDVYEQFGQIMASRPPEPAGQEPAGIRSLDRPVQRPETNEPGTVRIDSGRAPQGTHRGESERSAPSSGEQSGEASRPLSDRSGERPRAVAETDPLLRPDGDVAESDRLEKGHKPEPERAPDARRDNRSDLAISPKGNDFQVPYSPASGKKDVGVLIPTNMKQPLEQAMAALEDEVGDLDKFVKKELGYASTEDLHDAFMGLQVDSIASAIHEIKTGKAVIIADQTGIGKGRQAAGIIRWAEKQGHLPVFITKAPSLFSDMYGDLGDIGSDNIRPLIVNADEWITQADGSRAFANKPGHRKTLEQIRNTGQLPEDRNAVFLTYSQINAQGNLQQQFLRTIAPRSVFVLDESHNAGGESNTGEFLRDLLAGAKGVTYLSATYAKRPDNMPLYFKTDMGEAIGDSGTLIQAMKDGGLPLQTVVSHNLVKAGQMFRRERSYDGVEMKTKVDTDNRAKHTKLADGATEALRAIVDADHAFHTTYVAAAQEKAQAENRGSRIAGGGNQAEKTVHHTEFSSVVHNFVRQMLLGVKADTAADDAIASIQRGEKPIIAVDNTMGSFLNAYVGDKNVRDGERLEDFDYRTVLSRALQRTRVLAVKNAQGDVTHIPVALEELDPATRRAFDQAQGVIDKLKIDIPVSPIDWIRYRIEDAGHSVAEITGRNLSVDYSDPKAPKLSHVPTQEQHDKVETTRRFNDGRLDSLVINVAGSTGISLHASEKFADQRQRHMIVAQPAQDINIFMQMLGRIHRTGQVRLPKYTILNADLPAEKRPTALLSKKMKSLNANTSSNTESATSVKAADILNKYGDQIVGLYLGDNDALAHLLHVAPLTESGEPTEDIARKATGRLAILPVKVQEEFYRDVEGQYNDYIAYLDSTNQNELEPKTFDYDAKETRGETLLDATDPTSPFGDAAIYGEYSIKSQGKPLTPAEVTDSIKEHLEGKTAAEHARALIENLDRAFEDYRKAEEMDHGPDWVDTNGRSIRSRANDIARTARAFIDSHHIGSTWRVEINGDVYSAAVTNVRSTHKGTGNPFALSKINVTLATNGSLRTLSVPITQLQRIEVTPLYEKPEAVFRGTKTESRETAKIITGNLLAAYGELRDTGGSIINFTKHDGTTEQGILLPKRFSFANNTRGDYRLRDGKHAVTFLRKSLNPRIEDIGIASRDQNVRVINDAEKLVVVTPKSRARGGRYFLDRGITDLTGDFVSQQNTMRANIPKGKEAKVIDEIMKKSALYASPSMAEEAKALAPEEPKGSVKGLLSEETGELDVTRLKEAVSELYKQDVEAALTKVGLGVKDVAGFALRALYPRIEQSNPIGRALGVAAPSDAVDALMKVQGDRTKALAEFQLVLKGVSKMFDRLPEEARIDFIDRIQTGQKQVNSDLDDLAAMFKKIMDGQRQMEEDAANLGRKSGQLLELAKKQNYFHNWWETRPGKEPDEDEHERISRLFTPRRPLEGTKGYNKKQSYTLRSGIEAGGEPVTTNPVRILQHRIEDGMKFVTARQAWHEAHELDLRKFVRKGQQPPPGFDKIDDKIAKAYFPAALEFPGREEPTIVPHEIGEWYVEANTARLLNNMLSVDKVRGNALGRGLMWLKNMGTAIELGWSPFHAVFESIEAMSSMMSLGLQRSYNQGLRQGKPEQLLQGLKEIVSSPAAPIALAREGAALPAYIEARARLGKIGLTEYGHVISGDQPHGVMEAIQQFRELRKEKAIARLLKRYPDLDQLIDDMFQGGLVVGQHRDYQVRAFGKTMTEAWTANNPLGALWRAIPTIGQGVMYPLFNVYIPSLKYSLFLRMMSEQAAEHSRELENGSLTRATLARRVADSVENRFGELNFDNLFLNRSVKTALQFVFRSATYKMGTAREILGGLGGQSRELATWAHDVYGLLGGAGAGGGGGKGTGIEGLDSGEEEEPNNEKTFGEKALPRLDVRASWIFSLLLTSVIAGIAAGKLLSGKYPWKWLDEDEDLPGGKLAHLYLETLHPRTGETDSRGKPVRIGLPTYLKEIEHAATEPGRYIVSSLSSIVSRGMDLAANRDFFGNYVYNPNAPLATKVKQGAEYVAPTPFVYSNFERGKQQGESKTALLSAFGFPKSPSDLDFTAAEKLARDLQPHTPATPEELEEWRAKRQALEDGTATRAETKRYLQSQRLTWLQRQVKRMGYGDALSVLEVATPAEQADLQKIVNTKRANALKQGKGAEVEELEEEHQK